MSLLGSIGRLTAAAARPLTTAATLSRGSDTFQIRALVHKQMKPARAGHTGGEHDAVIRVDGQDIETDILQNDVITIGGVGWIVWVHAPSAAQGSIMVNVMAPPAEAVTPIDVTDVSDGAGGTTQSEAPLPTILAKIKSASSEKTLSAVSDEVLNQLVMSWPYDPSETAINAGTKVDVRGLAYSVVSVGIRDDNPTWRRAVLRRVD